VGGEPRLQQVLRPRHARREDRGRRRGDPSPSSPRSTTSGPPTRSTSSGAWPSRRVTSASRGSSTTAPAAPTSTITPRALPRLLAGQAPLQDTIIELDDIVGRLVAELEATGQAEDTFIFLSSDNGPEMETWPDAAYSPFRSAKGSTWEGGQRVPGIVAWPGMVAADRATDGLFSQMDLFNTLLRLGGAEGPSPSTATSTGRPDFVPLGRGGRVESQVRLLLAHNVFSALRVGEWKFMVASTSDDDRDCLNLGGSPASPRSTPTAGCTTSTSDRRRATAT